MSMQELLQAFGMFKQSVQEAATTSAVNDATQAMHQIKTGITNEAEQRKALQGLSDNLAMRLVGVGAPASTVQTAFNAIAPQQFGSVEQMQLEGALSGNKSYQQAAGKILGQRASTMQQEKLFEAGLKAQLQQQELLGKMQLEGVKAGMQKKELKSEEVTKLSEVGQSLQSLDVLQESFNSLDKSTWLPRTGNLSFGSTINPERASFEMAVKQNFDAYRKAITGAGASEKELSMLEQAQPNASDNPWQFQAKLDKAKQLGQMVMKRKVNEYKAAGRDMSGWQDMQAEERAQEAEASKSDAIFNRFTPMMGR